MNSSKSFRKQKSYLLSKAIVKLLLPIYQKYVIPYKVTKLRKKKIIRVLFVLNELGSWKTELLYNMMKVNSRFQPELIIVPDLNTEYAYDLLKDYLESKDYPYYTLSYAESIRKKIHPDIIFYQKPYEGVLDWHLFYNNNLYALFCYVTYSFRNRNYPGLGDIRFFDYVWQLYAENDKIIEESKAIFYSKGTNMVATGLPIMDSLLLEKSHFANPWKQMQNPRKRIIYAPHHTIHSEKDRFSSPFNYSTFLQFADFLLEMAKKYKESTQWAFKPHPLLRSKLNIVWGEKRTTDYYDSWANLENGQLAEGEYVGLFKHSDAMIHDCGSFKLEYLYTGNPVMYLNKGEEDNDYTNWQTSKALELHYLGINKAGIESFIKNVIVGVDPLKEEREAFVSDYLTPPNHKTACENIINAILGESEYSK